VSARAFHVAAAGIYFIDASDEDGGYVLKVFEFLSGATNVLKRLEGTPDYYLSVSPDGREFLYTLNGVDNADLTLVENFQ
jgi:hypothetical protein